MSTYRGKTGLYGIYNSNRRMDEHWGKNCFNSSFPTALACYMMEHSIPALYIHLEPVNGKNNEMRLACSELPIQDVFGCTGKNASDLEFDFESVFNPFEKYVYDELDGIDLVVADKSGKQLRPIEIKLTVFPDNSTVKSPERNWGSELVIRSATTIYCALGIYDSVSKAVGTPSIRNVFEAACSSIGDWKNDFEMTHKMPELLGRLQTFESLYYMHQKPILMQTLWKTKGQSPELADDTFQILVWSDFAFEKLISMMYDGTESSMSRPMRALARWIKCLWDLSKSNKINLSSIYREITYGNQTDKELSINGKRMRNLLKGISIGKFPILKSELPKIIDPSSIAKLKPERRLDQSLFFTMKNVFTGGGSK